MTQSVIVRVSLGLVALLCALLSLGAAQAGGLDKSDHVTQIEVYFDEGARLNIDTVQGAAFERVDRLHLPGYFDGASWLRLHVKPAADGRPLFVRIRPYNRNHLVLFEPDPRSRTGWRQSETGNGVAWQDRAAFSRDLGFVINPKETTTYFLRLQTLGGSSLDVQVLSEPEAERQELMDSLWRMGYFLVILSIVAWAIHQYTLSQDWLLLGFAFVHAAYVFMAMMTLGYLDVLLPSADWGDELLFWTVLATTGLCLFFHRQLLTQFAIPLWSRRIVDATLLANLSAFALMALGEEITALKFNSVLILVSIPLLLLIALQARGNDALSRRTLIIYYTLLTVSAFAHLLPVLGVVLLPRVFAVNITYLGDSTSLLYGHLNYGFVSALLFGHLLHARARASQQQKLAIALELGLSERELRWQKERLNEQERFMAMLTHELKNPLASIRLSLDAFVPEERPEVLARYQRIGRAVQDIDALLERCVMVDSIEQDRVKMFVVRLDPEEVINDVLAKFAVAYRVQVSCELDLPLMETDRHLLSTALTNLVENALKYAPENSVVALNVRADGEDAVVFQVCNAVGSAGLPDSRRMFEKYHRGKHTNGHRGTGLGLYLVQWIAERLGGRISVDLAQPNRIAFQLWLPLTPSQD